MHFEREPDRFVSSALSAQCQCSLSTLHCCSPCLQSRSCRQTKDAARAFCPVCVEPTPPNFNTAAAAAADPSFLGQIKRRRRRRRLKELFSTSARFPSAPQSSHTAAARRKTAGDAAADDGAVQCSGGVVLTAQLRCSTTIARAAPVKELPSPPSSVRRARAKPAAPERA